MSQLQVILTVGIPASSKSTWSKQKVKEAPNDWVRVSNDDIRALMNDSVYSAQMEKIVTSTRLFMIREALKANKNVIVDNLNLNKRHWTDVSKICQEMNKDIMLLEKHFYVELDEAIERDSKRIGKACLGEAIIKKWWKESGGKSFKHYSPRKEIFTKNINTSTEFVPMVQDKSLPKLLISDLDGTLALMNGRSPYDASTCDKDLPHEHIVELVKLYNQTGHKIIFVSGREDKDRAPTERFIQKYLPGISYELYMRPTGDLRKDVLIKEEIFNNHIKDKYYVSLWIDDRLQICQWLYKSGISFVRANNPEATF